MFTWFLLLRAIHINVVAFFYFVCWAFMVWTDTKGYFRLQLIREKFLRRRLKLRVRR